MAKPRVSQYFSNSSEYQREFAQKNPGKRKNSKLKYYFGITLDQYNQLLILQNNVCAICEKKEFGIDGRTKKVKALAVDHDHNTNEIRGLLCGNCNHALGKFKDNTELLLKAIKYLTKKENKCH